MSVPKDGTPSLSPKILYHIMGLGARKERRIRAKKPFLTLFVLACLLVFTEFPIRSACAEEGILGEFAERIDISGALEVEASYLDYDYDDPGPDEEGYDESDIVLATMELGLDMDINEYVKGHILFLWEEDETEEVEVDEGTITLSGFRYPVYLTAGKLYVPFGMFNTHFVSDPLTLELGETRESAVLVGYASDYFDVSVSAFNGDIDEAGSEDSEVENFCVAAVFTPSVEIIEDFEISFGLSWVSNIADSDGLGDYMIDELGRESVEDYVGGLGASVSVAYKAFSVELEYIGATDHFEPDELIEGKKAEPEAYNFELAYAINDRWEVAGKYEGTDDCGELWPEDQYGVAASCALFGGTTLSVEYLHGEYENNDEQDSLTVQLAIEF